MRIGCSGSHQQTRKALILCGKRLTRYVSQLVGIRPGEKIHEEMITPSDSYNTYDLGKYYTILPTVTPWDLEEFKNAHNAKQVPEGFSYNSGDNDEWETLESLRELIVHHVDKTFKV